MKASQQPQTSPATKRSSILADMMEKLVDQKADPVLSSSPAVREIWNKDKDKDEL